MREIKSPNDITFGGLTSIFLGGSIEMGTAEDWQTRLVNDLTNYSGIILNPRRDNWDPSWKQSIYNPQFREQVEWELDALSCASIVIFYFDPKTMSPITLMELGLAAASGSNVVVCCPDGFWRKGNVEIICVRFAIPLYDNYEDLLVYLKNIIKVTKYELS